MESKVMSTSGLDVNNAMLHTAKVQIKQKLLQNISSKVYNLLFKTYGNVKIAHINVDSLSGDKVFSGNVIVTCDVLDKGFNKIVEIPIKIADSIFTLPSENILKHKISMISGINHIQDKAIKLAKDQQDMINARIDKQEKLHIAGIKSRKLEREGKTVVVPTSGGIENTPGAALVRQMSYSKANLPSSIKDGDEIQLGPRRWRVSEGNIGMWNLALIEDK